MYNKKKFGFYFSIYLSLGHHKERPSYRRSLQPSAENIQPFKQKKTGCGSVSRSGYRSVSQWYGYEYPDPYHNVTDLQHTGPRNAVLDPVAIIVITISPSSHRKKRVLIRHFLCPKGV
jgi:hypothetical protein